MSSLRFLDLVKPFVPFLPEVQQPETKIPFNQKMMWTALTLLIFLVMSQMPLYGIVSSDNSDPLYWLRMVIASNRGTLMELGITPIISSGMVFQLLAGTHMIDVNLDLKSDRELYQTAQKLFAFILSAGTATVYVFTGLYGPPSDLGAGIVFLLILQLVVAGMIVILLDELLQKGYGLGSGISLFIATNICESIMWKAFSPTTINTGRGPEFEGAVIALFHLLMTWPNKQRAPPGGLLQAEPPQHHEPAGHHPGLRRRHLPPGLPRRDPRQVVSPAWRPRLVPRPPVLHVQHAHHAAVGAVLQRLPHQPDAVLALLREPPGPPLRCLGGQGRLLAAARRLRPRLLHVSPAQLQGRAPRPHPHRRLHRLHARRLRSLLQDVDRGLWLQPRDVAKQLKDQGLVMAGHRDQSMYKELKRIIPTAAAFGGACIGALSVASDLMGALGSGTGTLLAVTIIYGYFEIAAKEGDLAGMKGMIMG
ncbi:hypothetical protein ACCO45_007349 [Purpureocillium lilacinum]|uniref:Uncharacterized protein n=1 Tax=Purpureocillium lilacinum TaxID=33203 RepID=A0ACC4DSZ2_PURLI